MTVKLKNRVATSTYIMSNYKIHDVIKILLAMKPLKSSLETYMNS